MKQILMIGTGGTIASGKTAEGLMPELTSEQLRSMLSQPLRDEKRKLSIWKGRQEK